MPQSEANLPTLKATPLGETLSVLLAAFNATTHPYGCAILNPMVADDDWSKCNCWRGEARKKLLAAGLLTAESSGETR